MPESTEVLKIDILVEKSIDLLQGESLDQFSCALNDSGRPVVSRKLNLTKNDGSYMAQVFDGVSIWSIYSNNGGDKSGYYALTYSRDTQGNFTFGDIVEVRRTTTYEPVGTLSKTTKSMWVEAEKAVWNTAFVNNLPDSAFALILSGGKKDGEGKTVPRSLRMFPHHGSDVKSGTENTSVDLPHLRNALARVPQAKISASYRAKALAHLQAHAKQLLKGGTQKACGAGKGGKGSKDDMMPTKKNVKVEKDFWAGVV
jgi:hypothetical protein